MRVSAFAALLLVTACVAVVRPASAAPDFSTTTITIEPATPLEAELVTFTIRLRNTGPDDAGAVYVTVDWPLMGFFVDGTGANTLRLSFSLATPEKIVEGVTRVAAAVKEELAALGAAALVGR